MYITIGEWYVAKSTLRGRLLYKYGNATLYSVRIADLMINLLISLNSFQSSSAASLSLNNGSNFGPPGMAIPNAFAVKKDL